VILVNVGSVWALTVTPSPIAGQSFMITSSNSSSGDEITVRSGSGCSNSASIVGGGFVGILGSLSLTLHAGQYSASGFTTPNGCVPITVTKATPTTSVACLASTLSVGQMTTCTASLSNPGCFSPVICKGPSTSVPETVSWSDAGSVSFSSPTCTITTGTSCSVTVTGTGVGPASVNGAYAGDGDNKPSSDTFPLTINAAPPIPEYPYGLAILAIFMTLGYGLIKRRTGTKKLS